jgi:ectoine hydroxylase-related dioxygenase (phytanoyl-CoA dioxygenase family)
VTVAEHVARIGADGYTIVEDAIDPALCDALLADLARLERELSAGPAKNIFEGTRTVRIYNLLARGPLYAQIPVHDAVLPIVEQVLDRGCLVSSLSSIAIGPGEAAQPIHADDQLIPIPKPHPPTVCNSMWALTDFTDANGATLLVPGSHRWAQERDPTADEIVSAAMPAGSLLVYLGGTIHGGGANVSRSLMRTGLAFQYSLAWLRQEENQYLANPPEIARTYTERLQRLIGYDYGAPYLGFVDGDSPQRLLQDEHDGPRNRTSPEVDELSTRMKRHRWGDVEPVPTPATCAPTIPVSRGLLSDPK